MIKVIELRKAIQSFLKTEHPRVYFEVASDDADYPYVVYDLPNSFGADESTESFVVDIDGWDTPVNGDTTALETLMDAIDQALHRKVVAIGGMAIIFYRENRLTLKDDDKRIRRRKYVYQARVIGGG